MFGRGNKTKPLTTLQMSTTIIQKPYASFMKEALSFCETACGEYQIPVILISTRKMASSLLAEIIKWGICIDSAPTGGSIFNALKQEVDRKIVDSRLRKLEGSSLYISDQEHFSEGDWAELDTKDAKIVIIDDLTAVPSVDVLDKWAEGKGVKVIVRKDE